jgi:hypothetical protein
MRYLNEEGYVSDTEDSPMALSTPQPSPEQPSVGQPSVAEPSPKPSGTKDEL